MTSQVRPRPSSAQWPFIGVAALLVLLIFLTPALLTTGSSPPAGSPLTAAELIVDHAANANNTTYYVTSLSTSARYQSVTLGFEGISAWPFAGPVSSLRAWHWKNATNVLVVSVTNDSNPVAVNVTVKYVDSSGASAMYAGIFAFFLNRTTGELDASSLLRGLSPPPAVTPLSRLPIYLLLKGPS